MEGTIEHGVLAFEEAFTGKAFGLGWRLLIHPLTVLLSVDTSAGNEEEAPKVLLRREGREEVAGAVHVGSLVGFVCRPTGRGGVDASAEVRGECVG